MKTFSSKRIEEIITAIMAVAQGDFSVQIDISEDHDDLDALAMGFNMMTDDLREKYLIEKENEYIKHLNEELTAAKEKAELSDRLKSAFLANMSHEIRTPMNGILGFTGLLKRPDLPDEKKNDFIRIIEQSGERLLGLINDIINISKIEAGQQQVHLSTININHQVLFVFDSLRLDAKSKGLALACTYGLSDEEAIIRSDKEKLFGILTNLVKNAIKYTDRGKIEFGYIKQDDSIEFYVKDTGIGIAEDKQNDIFERFIQADINNKMARHGVGLGLSIAKAYVEMLGGSIRVNSKLGEGSTFYFTLPYGSETYDQLPEDIGDLTVPDRSDLRIVIAEDDDISFDLISLEMGNFTKEIIRAQTGFEVIDICRHRTDIDLILMDVQLPGLDGLEATRQIRNFNKEITIIAQTAYGFVEDREKAIEVGCNDYLSKPIGRTDLYSMINKYFQPGLK